jgi:vacuolar-type H+-ATPase subunit I/STV1
LLTKGIAPIPANVVEYGQGRGGGLAVVEDETRKQLAAGSEEQGFTFRTSFDPFNMIMQQLSKLDTKIDDLRKETDAKIEKQDTRFDRLDAKIDGLHQELHNTTRWIIGTIVAVAGVAVALASWLFR